MFSDVCCALVELVLAPLEVAFAGVEVVGAGRVVEGVGVEGVGGRERILCWAGHEQDVHGQCRCQRLRVMATHRHRAGE